MSLTWSALPICPNEDFDGAPLLRTEFALQEGHGPVARATLHATAHGIFEAYLNGQPVSDDVLSPGWSSYEWRLRYRSYDVTSLLQPTSVLGIALGNGWFRGRLGWGGGRAYYGEELAALAQLEIEFSDGYVQSVVTDETWTAGPSAVVSNDLYDGQTIDARRYSVAWLEPGLLRRCLDRRASQRIRFQHAHAVHRSIGPPSGGIASDQDLDLPGWQDSGRLWAEPGGLGSAQGTRPGRHNDHACGTLKCSSRTNWARGRCERPRQPTASSSAATMMSSSRPSPSTASAMSRSTDGPVNSPPDATHRRGGLLRIAADRRIRVLR